MLFVVWLYCGHINLVVTPPSLGHYRICVMYPIFILMPNYTMQWLYLVVLSIVMLRAFCFPIWFDLVVGFDHYS